MLTTTATAGLITVVGCAGDDGSGPADSDGLSSVTVEGTELVVEYDSETDATSLAVIAPSGEAFAEHELTPGASRETVALGTAYPPGTYTVQLVANDSVTAAVEQSIRPEIVITDLQLARNHPDEMYEGAAEQVIRTETILRVENRGTGPEKLSQLQFGGYVPRPTPEESDESGIVVVDNRPSYDAEPILEPDESLVLYSRVFPFSSSSEDVSCEPDGSSGDMTVSLNGTVGDASVQRTYEVTYTGDDLLTCDISIERGGS